MKPEPLPKFPTWPASAPVSLARYRRRRWGRDAAMFFFGMMCAFLAMNVWIYITIMRRGIGV